MLPSGAIVCVCGGGYVTGESLHKCRHKIIHDDSLLNSLSQNLKASYYMYNLIQYYYTV